MSVYLFEFLYNHVVILLWMIYTDPMKHPAGDVRMAVNRKIAEALKRISFEHREADYYHHTCDEDMFQYRKHWKG